MAKLTRVFQRIFGQDADLTQMGKFGSLAEGTPENSKDPAAIQSLDAWLEGWFGATIGANSPCIEDMNGAMFVFARQLAYIFQQGIPEWNAETSYYTGGFVAAGGVVYQSLTNDNLNNVVTNGTYWTAYGSNGRTITLTAQNILKTDDTVFMSTPSVGGLEATMPQAILCKGKKITLINTGIGTCGIYPFAGDTIQNLSVLDLSTPGQAVTMVSDGVTNWWVIS